MTGALKISDTHSNRVCVVALNGRIDSSNANDLMGHLTDLIGRGEKSILVDFAQVLYLTSAAFRALLVATDEAERNATRFVLCNLVGHVRELFEMGGLLEVFTILPSREEALKQLG